MIILYIFLFSSIFETRKNASPQGNILNHRKKKPGINDYMPQLFKNPHKIIKQAAKSKLAMSALALILLGSLATFLFTGDEVSEITKLIVFLVIAAVALLILKMPGTNRNKTTSAAQAAALCYRIEENEPKYLLIKTSGGRYIFPKGNVKMGEAHWLTAQREALEEAGATGNINTELLTTYWHHQKQVEVAVYLLKTTKLNQKNEKKRSPAWYSIEDAKVALADKRTKEYAKNILAVLQKAHSTILQLESGKN